MKGLAAVLCVAFVVMLAGVVSAQINPPDRPPQKDTPIDKTNPQEIKEIEQVQKVVPDQPAPNAESVNKVTIKKTKGTVVSVDAVASTMVVKEKKKSVTFIVDPNAKIMWGGNTVKLADIPKDGNVVVMYKMDGKAKIVTSISDQPATAKSTTMPPKTEAPKPPASPTPTKQ